MSTVTVYEIIDSDFMTHHIAFSQETAYFLRDWCQAISDYEGYGENYSVNAMVAFQ